MKIISTVPTYYFSKQLICILYTYSLNMHTTWSTQDKKWNFHFNRNYSKCLWCLTVSLSTQILILVITPISFISVSILCEFATLPDVYILLSPQQEELHCSSWGNRCTYLAAQLSKRLNTLSVIILVCLGNT